MNGQHHQQQYPTNPSGSMAQMPHEHGHAAALGPNPAFYPAVPLSAGQQAAVMGSPAVGHSHSQSTQHLHMPSYSLTQGQDTAYQHPGTSHQIHAREYSTSSFQHNGPTAPGTDSSATIYQAQPSQPHPMATQHHLYPHLQSISSNAYMGTAAQPTQTGQMSFLMGQAAASASSHSFRAAPLSRYDSTREQPSSMPGVSTGAAGSGPTGDTISVKRERASSNASALLKNATASARRDRNAAQLTSGSGSSPEDANKLSPDGERGALTGGASSRTKGGIDKKTGDGMTTITIFQCRGFEGCNMTFSRSEHLARHVRNEAMMQELVVLHANLAASAAQMQHAHMQVSNKTVTADEREAKEAGERRQGGLRSETQPGSELTSIDAGQALQPPAGPDAATRRGRNGYSQHAGSTAPVAPGSSVLSQEYNNRDFSRQSFHPLGGPLGLSHQQHNLQSSALPSDTGIAYRERYQGHHTQDSDVTGRSGLLRASPTLSAVSGTPNMAYVGLSYHPEMQTTGQNGDANSAPLQKRPIPSADAMSQMISSGIAAPSTPAVDMFGYQAPASHASSRNPVSMPPPGQQHHYGYSGPSYTSAQTTAEPLTARTAAPAPGNAEVSHATGTVSHTGADAVQAGGPHAKSDTSLTISDASTSVAVPAQQPSAVQNVSTGNTALGSDTRNMTPSGATAPLVNSSTYTGGSGSGPAGTDNLSNRRESNFSSMSSYQTFPGPGGWSSASTLRNGSFGDPLSGASNVGTAGTGQSTGPETTELAQHATQVPFDDYQPFQLLGGVGDGFDAYGLGPGFVRERSKSQSHGPAYQGGLLSAIQMRASNDGNNPFGFGDDRRASRALTPELPGSSRGRPVSASGRPASSRSRPASSRQSFGVTGAVVPFGQRPSSSAGLMGFLGLPPSGDFSLLGSAGGSAPGVSDIPSIEEHLAATSESVSGSRQGRPFTPSVVRHAVQSSDGRSGSVFGGLGSRIRTGSKDFSASGIGPLGERRSSRPSFSIDSIGRRPTTGSSAFDPLKLLGGIGSFPPGSASGRTGSRASNAGGGLSIFPSAFSMERSRPSSSSGPMSSAGLVSSTSALNGAGQSTRVPGLAHRLNTAGSDLRTSPPTASPFMFQPPAAPQDAAQVSNNLPPLNGARPPSSSRRFLGSMGSLFSAPPTADTGMNAVIPPLRLSGKRPADSDKISGSTDKEDADRHAPRLRTRSPGEPPRKGETPTRPKAAAVNTESEDDARLLLTLSSRGSIGDGTSAPAKPFGSTDASFRPARRVGDEPEADTDDRRVSISSEKRLSIASLLGPEGPELGSRPNTASAVPQHEARQVSNHKSASDGKGSGSTSAPASAVEPKAPAGFASVPHSNPDADVSPKTIPSTATSMPTAAKSSSLT
ncbi:Up in starvation [Tilletia horrida]|nr:Up in starvation [Tilletia horrida]